MGEGYRNMKIEVRIKKCILMGGWDEGKGAEHPHGTWMLQT